MMTLRPPTSPGAPGHGSVRNSGDVLGIMAIKQGLVRSPPVSQILTPAMFWRTMKLMSQTGESGLTCVELSCVRQFPVSVITKPPGIVSNLQSVNDDRGEIDIILETQFHALQLIHL